VLLFTGGKIGATKEEQPPADDHAHI